MNKPIFKLKYLVLLIIFLFHINGNTQTVNQYNSWWVYAGKYRLSNTLKVDLLYAWSRSDFVKNWQQSLLRIGTNYTPSEQISFGGGYEWIKLFPYGEQPIPIARTEHRFFEQVAIKNTIRKVVLQYKIRVEQRIINTSIKNRLRNKFSIKIPLLVCQNNYIKLRLSISNEFFMKLEKLPKGNYAEQNRSYLGLDVSLGKACIFNIAYLNQFLIKSNSAKENNHTLYIGLTHNMDFRK